MQWQGLQRAGKRVLLSRLIRQHQNYYRQYSNGFHDRSRGNTSTFKFGTTAIVAGSVTGYLIFQNQEHVHASTSEPTPIWNGLHLEVYAYYGCPFCSKLEAFLKYSQIPYTKIEVNAMTKAEVKLAGKPH